MPEDLALAIDRFLGDAPGSLRTAALRRLAHAVIEAWREGKITTAHALRALDESHEAMHGLAARHGAVA